MGAPSENEVERRCAVSDPDKMIGEVVPLQRPHCHFGIGFAVLRQQDFGLLKCMHGHIPRPLDGARNAGAPAGRSARPV
jgi:hypothetical protein